jgi:hypothetical protein
MNRYSDFRSNIKSGDLLAFTHRPWKSVYDAKIQMVRVFTKSEYSHVGVAVVLGGRVWCLEAVTPKIRLYPLSKLGDFWHITTNTHWNAEVEEFAFSKIGEDYSQWEALMAFFNKSYKDNLWYCDELARAIYEKAGLGLKGDLTPAGLVIEMQQRGGVTTYVTSD